MRLCPCNRCHKLQFLTPFIKFGFQEILYTCGLSKSLQSEDEMLQSHCSQKGTLASSIIDILLDYEPSFGGIGNVFNCCTSLQQLGPPFLQLLLNLPSRGIFSSYIFCGCCIHSKRWPLISFNYGGTLSQYMQSKIESIKWQSCRLRICFSMRTLAILCHFSITSRLFNLLYLLIL